MYTLITGAIGKEYVIKHYRYGVIRTKYPDMTHIVASLRQRKCRDLFKEAVAYARAIIADPVKKTAWQKKLRKRNSVFNAAIKEFMLREKKVKQAAELATNRLIRLAFRSKTNAVQNVVESMRAPLPVIGVNTNDEIHSLLDKTMCKIKPSVENRIASG